MSKTTYIRTALVVGLAPLFQNCFLVAHGGRELELWYFAVGALITVIGGRMLMRIGNKSDSGPGERFLLALLGGALFFLG